MEDFITKYGYLAIFIGCFFEGETILVAGGFAAHQGLLKLPWVIILAFLGTFTANVLFFSVGRLKGQALLRKRPQLQAKVAHLDALLIRYRWWLIMMFRFFYGFRTITPFAIGMSTLSTGQFLLLDTVSGIIWAIFVGGLGFVFGKTVELFMVDAKHYQLQFLLILVVVLPIIILVVSRHYNKIVQNTPLDSVKLTQQNSDLH